MKSLGELAIQKKFSAVDKPKHKYAWQVRAEEVSAYFGRPLYWLFHRFPEDMIMAQLSEFKYERCHDLQKFISLLQWRKKNSIVTTS